MVSQLFRLLQILRTGLLFLSPDKFMKSQTRKYSLVVHAKFRPVWYPTGIQLLVDSSLTLWLFAPSPTMQDFLVTDADVFLVTASDPSIHFVRIRLALPLLTANLDMKLKEFPTSPPAPRKARGVERNGTRCHWNAPPVSGGKKLRRLGGLHFSFFSSSTPRRLGVFGDRLYTV
ncbi:hypothetical protein C8F04DRAFT_1189596 [Mycena alexandri]|uniref:Uncharacterized protein n=1 Tax=Mycena alexandri TaxID=1745969 RepID=A0AAD6SG36_9AGAR|nr:hypothetical protein C8F04DRAFT_1189596 [Mycena alexandri]